MKRCPNCARTFGDNDTFCNECGVRLQDAANVEEPVRTTYCPQCGKAIGPGNAYCEECGRDLRGVDVPKDATFVKRPERPSAWFGFNLAVLIVMMIIGLVAFAQTQNPRCLFPGIIPIIGFNSAVRSKKEWLAGNYEKAQKMAKSARACPIIVIVLNVVFAIVLSSMQI